MKVSTAYYLIKDFSLTPQQFVELVEKLNEDVEDIAMSDAVDELHKEELEIERRLISNRILVLPFRKKNGKAARQKITHRMVPV